MVVLLSLTSKDVVVLWGAAEEGFSGLRVESTAQALGMVHVWSLFDVGVLVGGETSRFLLFLSVAEAVAWVVLPPSCGATPPLHLTSLEDELFELPLLLPVLPLSNGDPSP